MLKAENVTVRYGARTVVQDLSFELKEGEWLMLVGPNGAGKSTLIEAIAGGVPYAGKITLAGRNIRAFRASELARRIGVLAQKNAVSYAYSVEAVQKIHVRCLIMNCNIIIECCIYRSCTESEKQGEEEHHIYVL